MTRSLFAARVATFNDESFEEVSLLHYHNHCNFLLMQLSKFTTGQVGLYTETGMAMQAMFEAPYSVDSFFFIGATLVAYLLLKVLVMIDDDEGTLFFNGDTCIFFSR